jgi:hypothetical protein
MSLYSLNHSVVSNAQPDSQGKTAAKLIYACSKTGAIVMEERTGIEDFTRVELARFASDRELLAGKNGRIVETFIVALPREATMDQNQALVAAFSDRVAKGQAPWIAAIHTDKPGNPHAHISLFDEAAKKKSARGAGRRR